ncbi:MAG: class I SAM-dependent methyltransferase [Actinobacteria bacterium]|nr:class I SAM-dependent methyltransferase [Actinomycetota bacterium]
MTTTLSLLTLTGERTVPDVADERYWFERHIVAYRLAAAKAPGLTVLDAGCGEGYGAAALAAAGAARVVAVDVDPQVAPHVARRYPQVEAVEAELSDLPLPDDSFDLVVSLQVIEHVWDVEAFLASLCRVLRPGGELVVSTPNRLTFTPGSDTPINPFHVREFTADELRATLTEAGFHVGCLLGVHHGTLLRTADRMLRDAVPHVLAGSPPESWPAGVRRLVHRVDASWFELREDALDASLDLIALCRLPRPEAPGVDVPDAHDRRPSEAPSG